MKIQTSTLTGPALDWAVAKCEEPIGGYKSWVQAELDAGVVPSGSDYSTDWLAGGPIIEREGITVGPWDTSPSMAHYGTHHTVTSANPRMVGPTPLIAACRCYAASKLGDLIDVPDELVMP